MKDYIWDLENNTKLCWSTVKKVTRTEILMIQGFEGLSSLCMVRLFYKTFIKILFEQLRTEIAFLNPFSCSWTIRL